MDSLEMVHKKSLLDKRTFFFEKSYRQKRKKRINLIKKHSKLFNEFDFVYVNSHSEFLKMLFL